jgi:hypothetical protein
MVRYILIVTLTILMVLFIASTRAIGQEVKQWTIQDCKQYAADQVKELMALPDQQTQLNIMRKEKICGKESAFNCYTKLLTKLEKMCIKGELKEE